MVERHTSLTVLGILGILFGLVSVLYNGFLLLLVFALKSQGPELDATTAEAVRGVTGFVFLSLMVNAITGAMVFVAGIGFFSRQGWARICYLAAAAATVVNRVMVFPLHFSRGGDPSAPVVDHASQQASAMVGDTAAMAFNLFVVWYLMRPHVTARFTRAPAPTP